MERKVLHAYDDMLEIASDAVRNAVYAYADDLEVDDLRCSDDYVEFAFTVYRIRFADDGTPEETPVDEFYFCKHGDESDEEMSERFYDKLGEIVNRWTRKGRKGRKAHA